ncbi:hypothetical protein D3C78_1499440 [compost metagenome]
MTLDDAVLALLLSLEIHATDAAIRNTAGRCTKRIPRSKRYLMYSVANSPAPRVVVDYIRCNIERLG